MIEELANAAANFAAGVALPLFVLGSPTEWLVHRYLLHPEKRNFLNRASGIGHNDKHHGAYSGPEHYYRDVTNEHEIIHFSKGDVSLIAVGGLAVGTALDRVRSLSEKQPFGTNNVAFLAGMLTGTMAYYVAYEFTHHYMHVIGQRRLAINRTLGTLIQESSDGNLRFSKPLLDDICNEVEWRVDRFAGKDVPDIHYFPKNLIERLETQLNYNRTHEADARAGKPLVLLPKGDEEKALEELTELMINRETQYRAQLTRYQRFKYSIERYVQKQLRGSGTFQYIDNHHFVHHYQYKKNLNVVFPLADKIFGTQVDSSKKCLEENKTYWICLNSPDVKKFELEPKPADIVNV